MCLNNFLIFVVMGTSQSEENYLKALFSLRNDKNEVNISELSHVLSISTPSANSMVKKLATSGFVNYQKYKPLVVTEKGIVAAALIIRKHRLTEMYLVEKMNFPWDQVHEIAEQMEHIKSPLLFDRMDEIMGFPSTDPHGSPIPTKEGKIIERDLIPLHQIEKGTEVKLASLTNSSQQLLQFLTKKELSLGTALLVCDIEPFDMSVTVKYNNKIEVLSPKVAECLLMEIV